VTSRCTTKMEENTADPSSEVEGLRKRNVSIHAASEAEARKAVLKLNALEENASKKDEDKKTFGRTPDGTGRLQYRLELQSQSGHPASELAKADDRGSLHRTFHS